MVEEKREEQTEEMLQYEKETGKYAIWRGVVTEGFKNWKKGKKIYDRAKERISLYVSEETKENWKNFIENSDYTSISKLIRDSVDEYINHSTENKIDPQTVSNISHALKEPLTTIKGYSQLLIENYNGQLSEDISLTIRNIFDQSILLENRIITLLDNIKVGRTKCDILLIEDDVATIRLISSYFGAKGYICRGEISGKKGLEELENCIPKLVLLDIILPDISGYNICKTIKSNPKFKNIPIYYLTAINRSEVENNLELTGADGYILKPFDLTDFDELIELLNK